MNEWKVLAGRVTIFPAPSNVPLPSALELFKRLWDSEPTNFQAGKSSLSASIAQGTKDKLGFSCSVQPARIDVTISSVGDDPTEVPQLFVIEDSKQFHQELLEIISRVGRGLLANPVIRVATFLHVVLPGDNWTAVNNVLTSILPDPYKVKLTDEQEFALQVSRPRASTRVQVATLNRVIKWAGDRLQTMSLLLPTGNQPLATSPAGLDIKPTINTFFVASVTFDINNAPMAETLLTTEQQSALLLESLEETEASMRAIGITVKGFGNG